MSGPPLVSFGAVAVGAAPLERDHDDLRFRVMRALEADPTLSQRDLAREVGASLGLVNYCLKGLIDKGLVKLRNFQASPNKLRYVYTLTPKGIATKAALTRGFLARRIAEYEKLDAEITALREELNKTTSPGGGG